MSSIHDLSTETLRRVGKALSVSGELTQSTLEQHGLSSEAVSVTAALSPIPETARRAVVRAIMEERKRHSRRAPELVWTGPEAQVAEARRSAVVLRELFTKAKTRVLLAGYSFDHGEELLAPLHAAMRDRGVTVDLYLHVEQKAGPSGIPAALGVEEVIAEADKFFAKNWSWTDFVPTIWFDRRVLEGEVFASLHAKCTVIDGKRAYVTSANFTQRGVERNVEVGVKVEDASFAKRLERQFVSARTAGWFVELGRDT